MSRFAAAAFRIAPSIAHPAIVLDEQMMFNSEKTLILKIKSTRHSVFFISKSSDLISLETVV